MGSLRNIIVVPWRIACFVTRCVGVLLGVGAILLGAYIGVTNLWFDRFVLLSEVEGISARALEQSGTSFIVEEPIPQVGRGLYAFNVEVLSPAIATKEYAFYADGRAFNEFVAAIDFVEAPKSNQGAEAIVTGAGKGIESLIKEVKELVQKLVSSPIELAKSMASGGEMIAIYIGKVVGGQANLEEDAKKFIKRLLDEQRVTVAEEAGFDYASCLIPEAKERTTTLAFTRMGGMAAPQILTVFFAYASIPAKAQKLAKLQGAFRSGKLRPRLAVFLRRDRLRNASESAQKQLGHPAALQLAASSASVQAMHSEKILRAAEQTIRHQCDPVKLASPTNPRNANARFVRSMKAMHDLEAHGKDVAKELDRLLSRDIHSDFFYSRSVTRDHLLKEYAKCKEYGLFDSVDNLRTMSRDIGRSGAPTIMRGEYAGQKIHIDHRIPVSQAPELGNVILNLRVLPERVNLSRGNRFDAATLEAIDQFRAVGWSPHTELLKMADEFQGALQ